MKYRHVFQVNAPLEAVADFHSWADSLAAITPPPAVMRIHHAPERLVEGDELDMTLWLGPLPVGWLVRIEQVSAEGFTDRQLRGPFERWVHRHSFVALDEATTLVQDEVQLRTSRHLLWGPLGGLLAASLPALFAYRAWRTRQILEGTMPVPKSKPQMAEKENKTKRG